MNFDYFDLIASAIILLLGLKGIINGFFKEVFGLIGIIGGLFVASRVGDKAGQYLNDNIFNFSNHSAVSFTGFLVTLAAFWAVMIAIGFAFKKFGSMSGLGIIDRIFGFIFGAGKFFLIAAVIAFAIYHIKALRPTLDNAMKGSVLFPVLVDTGSFIMKLDPTEVHEKINTAIDATTETISDVKDNVSKNVQESVKENIEAIQQKAHENVQKNIEDINNKVKENIEEAKEAVTNAKEEAKEAINKEKTEETNEAEKEAEE